MIPGTSLLNRLQKVQSSLSAHEIDGILLTDIGNIGYISGFTGSAAFALITETEALFITDARYTLRASQECPHFSLVPIDEAGPYAETLSVTLLARPSIRRIGFEAAKVNIVQHTSLLRDNPTISWVSTERVVERLRMIKDVQEIAAIRQAISIAELAFIEIQGAIKPDALERDVAMEIEFAMRRGGAEDRAFESIVASGDQGARPHHRPNNRLLQLGDYVTIDWGARVDAYNSDITRTLHLGKPTTEEIDIYRIVLEAQKKAIDAIAPGVTGKEIDLVARECIAEHGFGSNFSHGLGHSLGRDVHDGPGFSSRGEPLILEPGMVLTVEPGIYREGWGGIRIEEDILVTDTGCEVLTNLPNDLLCLGQ